MEIFNIHIFEFILIAGLALVVFGPERLPEVGRFVGKQVARFLAWQQQSPELKMINDVRGEFEREIATLRDELVRTRNQLDVSKNIGEVQSELKSALDLRGDVKAALAAEPSIAPPATSAAATAASADSAAGAAEAAADAAEASIKAAEIAAEAAETALAAAQQAAAEIPAAPPPPAPLINGVESLPPPPNGVDGAVPAAARPNKVPGTEPTDIFSRPPLPAAPEPPSHRRGLHDAPPPDAPPGPPAPDEERERLLRRLEGLMADMHALVGELQGRGMIGPDWQPPSQANQQESITR